MADSVLPDLIPNEFGAFSATPPVRLLQAQATNLAIKTNGLVQAKVSTLGHGGKFLHNFSLVVSALDDYTYGVLRVVHPIVQLYPLTIINYLEDGKEIPCPDEPSYVIALTEIFASKQFKGIVGALIVQVQESAQ